MRTVGEQLGLPHIGPYTAPVGTTPIQIAAFGGPFTVINQSTTATVYLSDQAQVTANNSVTLFAGQAMVWVNPNPGLYAVASAPNTNVQITDLVRDYTGNIVPLATAIAVQILNSGVIMVDNPTLLGQLNGASGLIGPFDVTKFQSVDIVYSQGSAAASSILVAWRQAGQLIAQDAYGYDGTDLAPLNAKLACRGSTVEVQTSLGTSSIKLYGSNRPVSPYNTVSLVDRGLVALSNGALAPGGTLSGSPGSRYDGPAMVVAGYVSGAVADNIDWQIQDLHTGKTVAAGSLAGNANLVPGQSIAVMIPRNSWSITLINRCAAARNCFIAVTAGPDL